MTALEAVAAALSSVPGASAQAARHIAGRTLDAEASAMMPARHDAGAAQIIALARMTSPAARSAASDDGAGAAAGAMRPAWRAGFVRQQRHVATMRTNPDLDVRDTFGAMGGAAGGHQPGAPDAFQMFGYRPLTDDFEAWETIGSPNAANPSGQPIADVTYIRLTCGGD